MLFCLSFVFILPSLYLINVYPKNDFVFSIGLLGLTFGGYAFFSSLFNNQQTKPRETLTDMEVLPNELSSARFRSQPNGDKTVDLIKSGSTKD